MLKNNYILCDHCSAPILPAPAGATEKTEASCRRCNARLIPYQLTGGVHRIYRRNVQNLATLAQLRWLAEDRALSRSVIDYRVFRRALVAHAFKQRDVIARLFPPTLQLKIRGERYYAPSAERILCLPRSEAYVLLGRLCGIPTVELAERAGVRLKTIRIYLWRLSRKLSQVPE